MAPFAILSDLERGWKKLEGAMAERAVEKLEAASRLIRGKKYLRVDERIASGDLDTLVVMDVVCDMVRRVLTTPADGSVSSATQIGSTSISGTFGTAGRGGLYLSRAELDLLRPSQRRGRAGSTSTLPADAGVPPSNEDLIEAVIGVSGTRWPL